MTDRKVAYETREEPEWFQKYHKFDDSANKLNSASTNRSLNQLSVEALNQKPEDLLNIISCLQDRIQLEPGDRYLQKMIKIISKPEKIFNKLSNFAYLGTFVENLGGKCDDYLTEVLDSWLSAPVDLFNRGKTPEEKRRAANAALGRCYTFASSLILLENSGKGEAVQKGLRYWAGRSLDLDTKPVYELAIAYGLLPKDGFSTEDPKVGVTTTCATLTYLIAKYLTDMDRQDLSLVQSGRIDVAERMHSQMDSGLSNFRQSDFRQDPDNGTFNIELSNFYDVLDYSFTEIDSVLKQRAPSFLLAIDFANNSLGRDAYLLIVGNKLKESKGKNGIDSEWRLVSLPGNIVCFSLWTGEEMSQGDKNLFRDQILELLALNGKSRIAKSELRAPELDFLMDCFCHGIKTEKMEGGSERLKNRIISGWNLLPSRGIEVDLDKKDHWLKKLGFGRIVFEGTNASPKVKVNYLDWKATFSFDKNYQLEGWEGLTGKHKLWLETLFLSCLADIVSPEEPMSTGESKNMQPSNEIKIRTDSGKIRRVSSPYLMVLPCGYRSHSTWEEKPETMEIANKQKGLDLELLNDLFLQAQTNLMPLGKIWQSNGREIDEDSWKLYRLNLIKAIAKLPKKEESVRWKRGAVEQHKVGIYQTNPIVGFKPKDISYQITVCLPKTPNDGVGPFIKNCDSTLKSLQSLQSD